MLGQIGLLSEVSATVAVPTGGVMPCLVCRTEAAVLMALLLSLVDMFQS